ncbi:MAG: HNH endonuclease [Deltaproteobacteria bacterium]|nr:HNH endonuclease [Deltaproteobacteria bacterium]
MSKKMTHCIFCLENKYEKNNKSHILPESACNEDMILPEGFECNDCNQRFSKIEQKVIRSFPGQLFRVMGVEKTKRGKIPTSDVCGGKLKRMDGGERPTIQILGHSKSKNTPTLEIKNDKHVIKWETIKIVPSEISAFLARIALSYFCIQSKNVYSSEYENLRTCANSLGMKEFIPFLVGVNASSNQEIKLLSDNNDLVTRTVPVSVKFPGFFGLLPTASGIDLTDITELKTYLYGKFKTHCFAVPDPSWNKPIAFQLELTPMSDIAQKCHEKILKEGKRKFP